MCKVSICATEYERALSDTICAVICASYVLISLVALISLCNNCGNSPLLSNGWPWKQKHFINYSHLHFFFTPAVCTPRNHFISISLVRCPLPGLWLLSALWMPIFQHCFLRCRKHPTEQEGDHPLCLWMVWIVCLCVFMCVCVYVREEERETENTNAWRIERTVWFEMCLQISLCNDCRHSKLIKKKMHCTVCRLLAD